MVCEGSRIFRGRSFSLRAGRRVSPNPTSHRENSRTSLTHLENRLLADHDALVGGTCGDLDSRKHYGPLELGIRAYDRIVTY